jgi:hypothetical protein
MQRWTNSLFFMHYLFNKRVVINPKHELFTCLCAHMATCFALKFMTQRVGLKNHVVGVKIRGWMYMRREEWMIKISHVCTYTCGLAFPINPWFALGNDIWTRHIPVFINARLGWGVSSKWAYNIYSFNFFKLYLFSLYILLLMKLLFLLYRSTHFV